MYAKRYVNPHFWDDSYIIELSPEEKLLFLYCLTNPLAKIGGFYEISLRRMIFDTGLPKEVVEKGLKKFEKDGKIAYYQGFIIIPNYPKHQKYNPNMVKSILKDLEAFESLLKPSKAFQRLRKNLEESFKPFESLLNKVRNPSKGFERLREDEVEVEVEEEDEVEEKKPIHGNRIYKELYTQADEQKDLGGSTPKPPSPTSTEAGDNGHKPTSSLLSSDFPSRYNPKKDKGPVLGGKYKQTPQIRIGKFLELYEEIAEESYWAKLPEDRNQLLKLIWPRLSKLWKRYPSLEWWKGYFRAVSDNPGIQELVEKGEFIPSLPWLLEEKTVRKYLTGQYTEGKIPEEPRQESVVEGGG